MPVIQSGFKNVFSGDTASGFQIKLKSGYYRGVYLSLVESFVVKVDGKEYPRNQIKCSFNGKSYDQEKLKDSSERWQYGEPVTLTVNTNGGLEPGMHEVEVIYAIRISYMPMVPVVRNESAKIALVY
jgi:hypothetical protein